MIDPNKGRRWRNFLRLLRHERKRRGFSVIRRKLIMERDSLACRYCGDVTDSGHVDHIIPLSWGGHDYYTNLAWSCKDCNLSKGANFWQPTEVNKLSRLVTFFRILWYNDLPSLKDFI